MNVSKVIATAAVVAATAVWAAPHQQTHSVTVGSVQTCRMSPCVPPPEPVCRKKVVIIILICGADYQLSRLG